MTRELYIEAKVCEFAKSHGWLVRKLAWVGREGAPDRFFARAGRVLMIEFKRLGQKPAPHQEREIARLRAEGVEVHVIDNIEDGKALFA